MPRKYTRKPRKNNQRRRRGKQKSLIRRLPLNGFPNKNICKHRYADQCSIVYTGSSGMITHSFSANGLYDPNLAVGGHQPMGFDEQMAIYDHYCVLGAKITVNNITTLVSGAEPMIWGINPSDGSGSIVNVPPSDAMERINCSTI